MATAGKLKNTHLTCSVCFEVFQQPVTLACQHSFCRNCLEKYLQTKGEAVRNKSIPCPTCRQETPVPHPDRPVEEWAGQLKPGLLLTGLMDSLQVSHPDKPVEEWAGQLKPGLLLNGLMDSLQETVTCSSCKEEGETTPATHWCSECEAGFCHGCLKMHRKMPSLRHHIVNKLTDASSGQKIKRKFICREHDKKIKLYCKDCKEPLCTVCCSISHWKCEDAVTIQAILPEVKGQLQGRQKKLQIQMEECNTKIKCYEGEIEKGTDHKLMVKSDIEKTFESIMVHLQKKKDQLMKKLEDRSGEQTGQLRSKVKTKQIDLQTYQQQSQFIQQALELEDEAQLFEMYLSSGSGAVYDVTETQREDRRDVATFSFIKDLQQLKAEIDKMDVKVEKMDVDLTAEPVLQRVVDLTAEPVLQRVVDLTAQPVLQRVVDAKLNQRDTCNLRDVAVLNVGNRKITVVTDFSGKRIKSIDTLNGKHQCSTLVLDNYPRSIAVLDDTKVAVSVLSSRQIVTVNVNPALELHSTISTDKEYFGLDVLDQSTLVGSSESPPSVDILDMEGRERSLQTLPEPHRQLRLPFFIHVSRQGCILVSDSGLKSVICLTQTGHLEWMCTPTGVRELRDPQGITSTSRGDILVAEFSSNKVVHLSNRGKFIRDILTAPDGVEYPFGLCVDGHKLYVANENKGVNEYYFR